MPNSNELTAEIIGADISSDHEVEWGVVLCLALEIATSAVFVGGARE
ncbi:hypothetical protein I6E74_06235 [Salinibacterium sp. SWN139]|nr:hypothetical protein [Salinibacterium sp. SWN139]MBH0053769.1 hypothetical protein [Salinibacterium sp. SWN139]